ncbi:MAG: hypothetical protein WAL83_10170 [Arenicellales bacterium]
MASVVLPAHASTSPPPSPSSPCTGGEVIIANYTHAGGSVTVGLVGSVTLPDSGYYANFIYPGGTHVVALDTIGPGTYAATLNPGASFTEALCPGPVSVGVGFYPIGTTGDSGCYFYDTLTCTVTV